MKKMPLSCVAFIIGCVCPVHGITQPSKSDIGNFYTFLKSYTDRHGYTLSYLSQSWPDREQWRIRGRAKMQELLAYDAHASALNPQIIESAQQDGYTRHLLRYSITPDRQTEAFLLIPDGLAKPAPAVLALHDHGAFQFYGKEKITSIQNPPKILQDFIDRSYGGRTYVEELARQGFVVLAPDAFYFGSQRLDYKQSSERFAQQFSGLQSKDRDEFIRAHNLFTRDHETLTAKTIFLAGSTWPGIMLQGDRASVDYLLSRPEVDASRIGCMGLSIGGFRSAHLFGLDPRIKAAVVAGWMTTYDSLLYDHVRSHTWMIYVPQQTNFLDLPDVASLNAPNPLMVINCKRDKLFTMAGMRAAEKKLATVYEKMGLPERFQCRYYDVPHSLNVEMQDDAIAWLKKWLR